MRIAILIAIFAILAFVVEWKYGSFVRPTDPLRPELLLARSTSLLPRGMASGIDGTGEKSWWRAEPAALDSFWTLRIGRAMGARHRARLRVAVHIS